MPDLETVECVRCEESFVVHPDSNATEAGCCSTACETAGKGLA